MQRVREEVKFCSASVNGCSRWIEFQKIVAPAINYGPDNQYGIWPLCYCSALGVGFLHLMMSRRHSSAPEPFKYPEQANKHL